MPNLSNKKLDYAKTRLDTNGIHYIIYGEGSKVVKQSPEANSIITTNDTVYLITNDDNIKVPNVTGLSSKEAIDILQKLGINVKLDGVGYVTEQSISEGTEITKGLEISLTLAPKFSAE